jgi:hypothetical protein
MYWPPRSAGGLPADGFNVNLLQLISNVFDRRFLLRSCEFEVNGRQEPPDKELSDKDQASAGRA